MIRALIYILIATGMLTTPLYSAAQKDHTHWSRLAYAFDRAFIFITSEFASDSALKLAPTYVTPPYQQRTIFVYGPTLSVRLIPIPALTAATRLPDGFQGPLTGHITDSSFRAVPLFDIEQLEVQVSRNDSLHSDWRAVKRIRVSQEAVRATDRPNLPLFADTIQPGETVVIRLRNRLTGQNLVSFLLKGMPATLLPYLSGWMQENSPTVQRSAFLAKQLAEKTKLASVDSFYRYWPDYYGGGRRLENITGDTKLAMYFRKPSPSCPDSSLEYFLTDKPLKNLRWQRSGHLLVLPALHAGRNYTLLVRYPENPTGIRAFIFTTPPEWYQTKRFWLLALGGLVLAVSLLFALRYLLRWRNEKKKNTALKNHLRSIRSQLNPHFLFNALASIQGLINKNDIAGANHYLSGFSRLLRETLHNSDKEFIPFTEELNLIGNYLALEQLRFHFRYTIHADAELKTADIELPALLLQPIVENAVKHGAGPLGENGEISIQASAKQDDLIVTVTDNGRGFVTGKPGQNGWGLRLTEERIRILNQSMKQTAIRMQITSSGDTGTVVHLVFQNWL